MSLHYSKVISYLVFIELLIFVSAIDHLVCDPRVNCALSSASDKVPNPLDCFSYYYCIKDKFGNIVPTDNPIACQKGYYFSAVSKDCVVGTECRYPCPVLCNPNCNYYANERIADVNDCSTYYTCETNRTKVKHTCPDNAPYFNGVSCSTKNYSCCTDDEKCIPFCDEVYFKQIVDPYDCHGFYLCLFDGIGIPTEKHRLKCNEGQYFDPNLGRCTLENSPCTSLCSK